ncbi:FUSC family membrane protein [Mucilaginibacter antarcticus]|uniref:FUSC family membrane protein n=1 Tax=Mucilaginibacter antarcticus TaxID=1855725 RepID=A0ABW5XSI0_9SPHI
MKLSENTADALRNTLTVLLPLLLLYSKLPQMAVGMSVGALLISLTDLPGNRRAKTRSALQCISIFFLVTLVFSASLHSTVLTGIVLVALTFILSMLSALGGRSTAAGMMGVALMVFLLGLRPAEPWAFSAYIMLGGLWFYGVVLVQVFLFPFRSLRQALREALFAIGRFLEAKAACYDIKVPLDEGYSRTIALHLRVSEKQELVRQLLISDKVAIRKGGTKIETLSSRAMLVMSLYEQVTAMHYDYAVVRERLGSTGALDISGELIVYLSKKAKGDAIADNKFSALLMQLEQQADNMGKQDAPIIRGIAKNVTAINLTLDQIGNTGVRQAVNVPQDAEAFLPDSGNYREKLKSQLRFSSPVLRFAMRISVLLAIGYAAVHLFADDNYSYWLLLTVVIVARPRLAVTWQRNKERLIGTFIGVLIAGLALWWLPNTVALLALAALGLFGFFAWNRPRYGWSVSAITVCVLLSLSVYRGEVLLLISARVWYSLWGCALAVLGVFVFPIWSHAGLEALVVQAVKANRDFLQTVSKQRPVNEVWLARKNAHVKLAHLSEGLGFAGLEPTKGDLSRLLHIQVLNYRINAVIISLFLSGRLLDTENITSALNNLDNFIANKITDEPVKHTGFLKGAQLLEMLSRQLSAHSF